MAQDDQSFTPDQRNYLLNAYVGINNTPRHKKLSKEHENALSGALSLPRTFNNQTVTGVRTPQEIASTRMDALKTETTAKNDIEWGEIQRRANQYKTKYNLSDKDALALATGHALPAGSHLQKTSVIIHGPNGSSHTAYVNYDPETGKYSDDAGNPVDDSTISPMANAGRQQLKPVEIRNGSQVTRGFAVFDPTSGKLTEVDTNMKPVRGLQKVFDPATNTEYYTPEEAASGAPTSKTFYNWAGEGYTAGSPVTTSPPPNVPEAAQKELAGWEINNNLANKVLSDLQEYKGKLGPLWGRVLSLQVGQLGSYGTTPEERQLAIDIQNLFMTRAFADGGKQLTGPELTQFQKALPRNEDTVEMALKKTEEAIRYANMVREVKFKYLTPRQQNQLTNPTTGAGPKRTVAAPPTTSTSPAAPAPGAKPTVEYSKSKKMYRWSYDGGKTWATGTTPPK